MNAGIKFYNLLLRNYDKDDFFKLNINGAAPKFYIEDSVLEICTIKEDKEAVS